MPIAAWHTVSETESSYESVLECNRYMLDNEVACDITFIVAAPDGASEKIKAHRYMLISRNPVFRVMFCGGMAEVGQEIEVPDLQPSALKKVIRYLYCESIDLNEDDIFDVLYAAKKYMIKQLEERCFTHLNKHMTVENVCNTLNHVIFYEESDLEKQCLKLISAKTSAIIDSKDFLNLSKESIRKIARLQTLSVPEASIVEMCLKWAEAECARDSKDYHPSCVREYLADAFYHLRIPNLDNGHLQSLVWGTGLLDSSEEENLKCFLGNTTAMEESKFLTTPRRWREAGQFVCPLTVSRISRYSMDYKKAKTHLIKVSEDILVQGVDIVDCQGSYLNGVHVAIAQDNLILFRTGMPISAARKETEFGKVIPVHLPKHIPVKAGEFEIHLTFRAVGGCVGCCSPQRGPIEVNGINFEVSSEESFHISCLRFNVD